MVWVAVRENIYKESESERDMNREVGVAWWRGCTNANNNSNNNNKKRDREGCIYIKGVGGEGRRGWRDGWRCGGW